MPFVLLSAQVESTVNCWEPMPVVARVRCQRFNIDRDMWYRTQAGMRVSGPAVAMHCPLEGKVRLSSNSSMYVLRGLPGFSVRTGLRGFSIPECTGNSITEESGAHPPSHPMPAEASRRQAAGCHHFVNATSANSRPAPASRAFVVAIPPSGTFSFMLGAWSSSATPPSQAIPTRLQPLQKSLNFFLWAFPMDANWLDPPEQSLMLPDTCQSSFC